jgi:uncharacterized membrane protein YcfT
MSTKLKFWIIGVVVAALGLVIARIVSPVFSDQSAVQLVIFLAGVVIALAGLGIIIMGIRKH